MRVIIVGKPDLSYAFITCAHGTSIKGWRFFLAFLFFLAFFILGAVASLLS